MNGVGSGGGGLLLLLLGVGGGGGGLEPAGLKSRPVDLTGLWALDSHLPTLPLTTSPGFVFKNVFALCKL